jgi:hypothetical protein
MRIRTIKPDFFWSRDIQALSLQARLVYIALWCFADDEGRFEYRPRRLWATFFIEDPLLTELAFVEAINELSGRTHVVLREIGGKTYGYLPKFKLHQKINNATKSKLPPLPEDYGRSTVGVPVGREGKGSGRQRQRLPAELLSTPLLDATSVQDAANVNEPSAPTRPARRSNVPRGTSDDYKQKGQIQQATLAMYCEEFKRVCHVGYVVMAKRDARAAHELAGLVRDEALRRAVMRLYVADTDRFLVGKGHPLHELPGRVNAYLGRAKEEISAYVDPEDRLEQKLADEEMKLNKPLICPETAIPGPPTQSATQKAFRVGDDGDRSMAANGSSGRAKPGEGA